jgi:hypothetical protein
MATLNASQLELTIKKWTKYDICDMWLVRRTGAAGQGLSFGALVSDVAEDLAEWFESKGVKVSRTECDLPFEDDAPLLDAENTKRQKSLLYPEPSDD